MGAEDGYYRWRDAPLDANTFDTAALSVGEDKAPALLHDLYYGGSIADPAVLAHVVADVWDIAEFPQTLMPPEIWLDLFLHAGYTHDGQPAARPSYPSPCTAAAILSAGSACRGPPTGDGAVVRKQGPRARHRQRVCALRRSGPAAGLHTRRAVVKQLTCSTRPRSTTTPFHCSPPSRTYTDQDNMDDYDRTDDPRRYHHARRRTVSDDIRGHRRRADPVLPRN